MVTIPYVYKAWALRQQMLDGERNQAVVTVRLVITRHQVTMDETSMANSHASQDRLGAAVTDMFVRPRRGHTAGKLAHLRCCAIRIPPGLPSGEGSHADVWKGIPMWDWTLVAVPGRRCSSKHIRALIPGNTDMCRDPTKANSVSPFNQQI